MADLTPEEEKARDSFHRLFQQFADTVFESEGIIVTEWVLVIAALDSEGSGQVARLVSQDLVTWKRAGLLHDALYGNWSNDD